MGARTAGRCAVVLAMLLTTGALAQPQSLTGTWSGPVTQNPPSKTPYRVVLTIEKIDGQSDYPELNCGGRLARVGAAKGYVFFTETITRGKDKCIDGTVTIAPAGNNLVWGWIGAFRGKAFVAWATLTRN